MTRAELTPARLATSAIRVSPQPRSQISSAAARSISIRRASFCSVAGAGSAMVSFMSYTYDDLVIGGGHNGLISGAYLARSGARTLVLEGRCFFGGAATTE